jgi:hypothetical protein
VDPGPTACTGARAAKRAVRVCALGRSSHYATRRSRSIAIAMATLWTGRDMPPLVLQWFCSTWVRMVDVVASASSTHARAPCLGQAVPHARLQHACWVRSPHSSRGVMCCRGPRTREARLPVQTCAGRSVVVVEQAQRGAGQAVHGRRAGRPPCPAVPMEVGAPAPQDGDAAGVWTMSRRPRTETSPWSVALWSPLCPNRAVTHSVDERSMRGACPGFRTGTKLVFCARVCAIL